MVCRTDATAVHTFVDVFGVRTEMMVRIVRISSVAEP
jgi:hypothetical protein